MKEQNQTATQAVPNHTADAAPNSVPLQPYHPPTFVRYGSVASIVQNMEGVGADGGGGFPSDTLS